MILAGCESMPFSNGLGNLFKQPAKQNDVVESNNTQQSPVHEQMLTDQLKNFIINAPKGEIVHIEKSPWSTNHEIMALEKYTSATGRKCRALRLIHSIKGLPNKQFVCEDDDGEWVPIRCIIR